MPRKKPPMTEEERLLYGEMQRLKAEDARRQKADQLKQMLKQRKEEEDRHTKTNLLKIQENWRKIMRRTKVVELKKEVDILSQSHEREVDRKDAILDMLLQDLEESEEQYQIATRAHLRNVDALIKLHEDRVLMLERDFQFALDSLSDEFNSEREQAIERYKVEMGEISDIMAYMQKEFERAVSKINSAHQENTEELKRKHEDGLVNISNNLRQEVLELYQHFRQAMEQYNALTYDKQVKFRNLKTIDKSNAETMENNTKRIKNFQEQRDLIKAKMLTNDREFREKNKSLKEEKEAVTMHFRRLKARMHAFRDEEAQRLRDLTITSNDTIKQLEAKLAQAEKILALAEINRKHETEEEKVLPFYQNAILEEDVPDELAGQLMTPAGSGEKGAQRAEWNMLDNFYKRYNKVLLDKHALEEEEKSLLGENNNLRTLLKQYLQGISVSEEVLAEQNPLFIINPSNQYTRQNPAASGIGIPVVEATHLVIQNHV